MTTDALPVELVRGPEAVWAVALPLWAGLIESLPHLQARLSHCRDAIPVGAHHREGGTSLLPLSPRR
ncbi:MAG TPA: hypothetical protein VGN15_09085, partial [Ktedonobacteraceae bacterium]|nr:hypothetical protein [Ktedonobacteraceae bacterium]